MKGKRRESKRRKGSPEIYFDLLPAAKFSSNTALQAVPSLFLVLAFDSRK